MKEGSIDIPHATWRCCEHAQSRDECFCCFVACRGKSLTTLQYYTVSRCLPQHLYTSRYPPAHAVLPTASLTSNLYPIHLL